MGRLQSLGASGGRFKAAPAVAALIVVAGTAGCSARIVEAVYWQYGFRNDTDAILILDMPGMSRIMPGHSSQMADHFLEDEVISLAVFSVECVALGSATLSQDQPILYIDEAGRVSAEALEATSRTSPSATLMPESRDLALLGGHTCSSDRWQVDVRNDLDTDVLVRRNFARLGLYEPSIVIAGSRGQLATGYIDLYIGDDLLAEGHLSAEVRRSDDCSLLGTVTLSHEANVIYIDAEGKLSAQPQSVFWEEPPAAVFRKIRDAPSACAGAWQVERASASL